VRGGVPSVRTVAFHRNFQRFQGGHLKVFHYFEHVRSSPAYEARISFSADSLWDDSNPWSRLRETVIPVEDAADADVLFLAGMDWRSLEPARRVESPAPIVNLIQGFRHTRADDAAYEFLAHRAIRLCVSAEIEERLRSLGTVRGPIFTVPIALDLEHLPPARAAHERDIDCMVLAVKDREHGRSLARQLKAQGHRVLLIERPLPRDQLLDAMARARVTVHLPATVEGAYLPALESMALGALVVCPDCVGNRSFCRDGETCLVPAREERAILEATCAALSESDDALEPLLAAARLECASRSLAAERVRFLEILGRVEEYWSA
jgi:glycosyltransferase involved in cell wall biosynthesis